MAGARVVDGARASACWVVTFADQEKNFPSKAAAVAWLRAQTKDTRLTPVCQRLDRGAYAYYGPGRGSIVAKATILKCSFANVRARAPKPLFSQIGD